MSGRCAIAICAAPRVSVADHLHEAGIVAMTVHDDSVTRAHRDRFAQPILALLVEVPPRDPEIAARGAVAVLSREAAGAAARCLRPQPTKAIPTRSTSSSGVSTISTLWCTLSIGLRGRALPHRANIGVGSA